MINKLLGSGGQNDEERGLSFDDWLSYFSYNGMSYPLVGGGALRSSALAPDSTFVGWVNNVYQTDGVVSAAVAMRARLISQLTFRWRSLLPGDNGRLFGTEALTLFEEPAAGVTRQALLSTAEVHASLAGMAVFHRAPDGLRLLRPDWVTVMMGSDRAPEAAVDQSDATFVGIVYDPGGSGVGEPEYYPANEVALWCPEPDPLAWWRGASWVQSVLAEIGTMRQTQVYKSKFFENGATPQLVVLLDPAVTEDAARQYADGFRREHEGVSSAYRTLFMGGGADVKVVGSDLGTLDLKNVVGNDENRVALRSGIPAALLGTHLEGASLNQGNYSQLKRILADTWLAPTAQGLCAALEHLAVKPPERFGPAELAYDPKEILFLQDDRKDEADMQLTISQTMRTLLDAGYTSESVTAAVSANDFSQLVHSGLVSVQLQAPESQTSSNMADGEGVE
jgi:hypothetical protein